MRWQCAIVLVLTFALTGQSGLSLPADDKSQEELAKLPPWQRLLKGDDAKKAAELQKQIDKHWEVAEFEKALPLAEALVQLRRKVQGADHWEVTNATWQVEAFRRTLKSDAAAQKEMADVLALARKASQHRAQGQYREEQPLRERMLATHQRVLGKEHPLTATSYNNLAANQMAQGKYTLAEMLNVEALSLRRRLLDEGHPDTTDSYSNLASSLNAQGKHAEAERDHRMALAQRRKLLGEENRATANSYANLSICLHEQGRYAEAEEGIRTGLALYLRLLGEEHSETAQSYNDLAMNLSEQGKLTEAEVVLHKALIIRRKLLGEEHHSTAQSYNNLAVNLNAQGRYAEAAEAAHRAYTSNRKLFGEENPSTAISYYNLSANLAAEGMLFEAEKGIRQTLSWFQKMLGSEHPILATCYNQLATILNAQENYTGAYEELQKALTLRRKLLGEEHPDTANSYNNLAANLYMQGRYSDAEAISRKVLSHSHRVQNDDQPGAATLYHNLASALYAQAKYTEAVTVWEQAANRFFRTRLHIAQSGLKRAVITGRDSRVGTLAAVLARHGKYTGAWQHYEESLARGTWDDLSTRLRRTPEDQTRQSVLVTLLDRLDKQIEQTISPKETPDAKKRRDDLLTQRLKAQDELTALTREFEKKYGPVAGQVFDRVTIQKALPDNAVLLGWLDIEGQPKAVDPNGEHWAFLLRSAGDPVCVRIRGTGPGESWTKADTGLPGRLRAALLERSSDWQSLAERVRKQRLGPVLPHLAARDGLPKVEWLIVLPSTALAGVPVEVFAKGFTVSYALSGTLYAHLKQQPRPTGQGVLALADPVFDTVARKPLPPPKLPPGGVLITQVVPGSPAAKNRLKPGDVLLRYGNVELKTPDDLSKQVEAQAKVKEVVITVWQDGIAGNRLIPTGKLGVAVAREPAPQAIAEKHKTDEWLAAMQHRGDDEKWKPLPGTRVEAEALRQLFAADPAAFRLLASSGASEQALYELAKDGGLGKFRYLHLATHGSVDERFPLRSAVILSRDNLPDTGKQFDAGLPIYDGKLSAEEVLRHWNLNAELVTLSACQTALGKYERGEGFVGFTQALTFAGARSVCLSLWKVDDAATALLMERFYQNLLGKRAGLKAPLGKAAALAEAKQWLRELRVDEATQRLATLTKGVARGPQKVKPADPTTPPPAAAAVPKGPRPYAHPYYWAAFVLIGEAE